MKVVCNRNNQAPQTPLGRAGQKLLRNPQRSGAHDSVSCCVVNLSPWMHETESCAPPSRGKMLSINAFQDSCRVVYLGSNEALKSTKRLDCQVFEPRYLPRYRHRQHMCKSFLF